MGVTFKQLTGEQALPHWLGVEACTCVEALRSHTKVGADLDLSFKAALVTPVGLLIWLE